MKKRNLRITQMISVVLAVIFTTLIFVLEFVPNLSITKTILLFGSIFSIVTTALSEWLLLIKPNSSKSKITIWSMVIGIFVIMCVYISKLLYSPLYDWITLFSAKGGFWAISTALLFIILLGNQYEDEQESNQLLSDREHNLIEQENALLQQQLDNLNKDSESKKTLLKYVQDQLDKNDNEN
ncbi:hypothetical protein ESZ50_07950 [Weissella muntiaci]|uniref:Uncharacterized protein n=1 Tax=Weissella muntiaci TaxID=2508881 RepID=A0A6C2C4D8_9LACO|nr:hypothetical protein [Weissella muntiaci]TYC48801.1 hypothetical protein ESZ50_07950 [Weissella muntiaci]